MSLALIGGGLALVALGIGLALLTVELVSIHRRLVAVERVVAELPCAEVSAPASDSSTTEQRCDAYHNGDMGNDSEGRPWRLHCTLLAGHAGLHLDGAGADFSTPLPELVGTVERPLDGRPTSDLAAHVFTAAAAARAAERTNVGRDGQPALGRHSPEYQATVEPTVGLFPMGAAGRVTLEEHLADGADVDRGDRQSWSPPRFTDEETPDAS